MGREAQCACTWNGTMCQVKALIEPPDLILRGDLRKKFPIASLREVRADGPVLRFTGNDGRFALALGADRAARWAAALLKPAPSLAQKLGIRPETIVRMIGPLDDQALRAALAQAQKIAVAQADLIVARVDAPSDLARALELAASDLARGAPIWIVYRKGAGQPLQENAVRSAALAAGVIDTKVASVSAEFTGLRFTRRRSP